MRYWDCRIGRADFGQRNTGRFMMNRPSSKERTHEKPAVVSRSGFAVPVHMLQGV